MKLYIIVTTVFLLLEFTVAQKIKLFPDEEDECLKEIDLMIVLDGSFSVTAANFEVVKDWVKMVAEGMHIDHGHIQIGVVQYSHYYSNRPWNQQQYMKTEIGLGEHRNMEDFDTAVNRIRYQGYKTYTAHALNKTLNKDFVGPTNRYPVAKRALILLTDGKATDSSELPPVIERAENELGVVMYAVGVGDYDEDELNLIAHNHTERVFTLKNFEDLNKIVEDLQIQLQTTCDCDFVGSTGSKCDPCSRQCICKDNIVGRRCDSCAEGHYGFGNKNGCLECACNQLGSLNETCHQVTGQCNCRSGIEGRDCGSCPDGFYGFPECRPCECNGFSKSCDKLTGVCIMCLEGRKGDHCEICPSGHFLEEETTGACVPCRCNGNVDLNDPDACNPVSGECQKCLHNTVGSECEKCAKFYHGNALVQSCTRCKCNLNGTILSTCEGDQCVCEDTGSCSCLPNVEGSSCNKCAPGSWKMSSGKGCILCGCSSTGSQSNTTCNEETGECVCMTGYTGMKCTECKEGYDRDEEGDCIELQGDDYGNEPETTASTTTTAATTTTTTAATTTTTTAATTTTTKATTTSKPRTRKPIRVNPGWSPCVSCGRQKWPSYCRGWMCRRRWPYSQQTPSSRRCYSWHWSCRASVESSRYQQSYFQPSYRQSNYNSYYRQPTYFRGYYHHPRFYRPRQTYRPPARYNLYRN